MYNELKLDNGNTIYYLTVDDTSFTVALRLKDGKMEDYTKTVNADLINILLSCIRNKNRIRIWYGDTKTGESWLDEYDVTGVLSRSMGGRFKIPILLHDSRSYWGGAILDSCLVRIDDIATKRTLWKVDNFHCPDFRIVETDGEYPYKVEVKKDGEDWKADASFQDKTRAQKWVDFMTGKRYSK